jgi:type II secretory pathway pseudopilin PulG
MKSMAAFHRPGSRQRSAEGGYILITLMMMATIVVIMLAVVLPQMAQQVRRDQEMELIHRGVQYSRAIRRFFKKNGRYPVRLEELENSNNIRYIRQRYKDPTTGKDFKLLHFGEVRVGVAGIAGGVAPGANALGAVPGPSTDTSSGQSSLGSAGTPNTGAALNPRGALSNQTTDSSGGGSSAAGTSSSFSNASAPGDSSGRGSSSPFSSNQPGSGSASGFSGQVFGGGPIVGVVSTSKKQSIREFNKKNHYNDWQFIYDPSTDRGGLLNTPAQPALQGVPAQNQQPAGVPVLTPGGQQGNFGGQGGPGMAPQQNMMPQMPPDQQQAPQ